MSIKSFTEIDVEFNWKGNDMLAVMPMEDGYILDEVNIFRINSRGEKTIPPESIMRVIRRSVRDRDLIDKAHDRIAELMENPEL